MESVDEHRVFLSVISSGELRYGVERMLREARRSRLEEWPQDELPLRSGLRAGFYPSIATSPGLAEKQYSSEALGRPIGAMDAFLAATTQTHRLTLVTRHVSDFPLLEAVLNPWKDAGTKG